VVQSGTPDAREPSTEQVLAAIGREARRAERRMRLSRVLAVLPLATTWASVLAALAIAARKIAPDAVTERGATVGLALAAMGWLLALLVAALRRLPPYAGALALDRHHALSGRLANALEFGRRVPGERSAMMTAAIDDARAAVRAGLSASRAVPVPIPGEIVVGLGAVLGLGLVALLEARRWQPLPPPLRVTKSADVVEVSPDDLELFREAMRNVEQKDESPELRESVDAFNRLIEDLAERRVSRDEAFRRMRELEDRLSRETDEEREAMKKALADLANELSRSDLAKPAGEALRRQDYAGARDEVKKLADRLASKKKPSKAELDRLKKALDRASRSNEEAQKRIEEQRADLKQSLLKAKEQVEKAPADERQKSLLKKKERELERLEREAKRRESTGRRLNRLERQLGKAAADLLRDLGASAEDLEQLTEDLNRMEQEELTDKEKEDLRQRIQELRELIRQQGQGGDKLKQRLQRFMKQARGGQGQRPGQRGGKQGKQGRGGDGQQGDDGDLRPGGAEGNDGEGDEPGKGPGLRFGRGGKSIPVEVPGGSGGQAGPSGGEGDQPGGSEAGKGSAPKLGGASDIDGKTLDVQAEGLDSGKGPTNAEVILGAADRGFTGKAYRKVFKQYQTVAEDQVEREKIPDGMRFYVRRYFQLIRPRE